MSVLSSEQIGYRGVDMENYKGYRFEADGRYYPGDLLQTNDDMFQYVKDQMKTYPLVRVVDDEDLIIAEAKEGHIVFPKYLAVLNIREESRKIDPFNPVDFMERLRGSEMDLSVQVPNNREQAEELLNRLYTHYTAALKSNNNLF